MADSFYGRSHEFRAWLEERGRAYAVMVPKTNMVPLQGTQEKIELARRAAARGCFLRVSSCAGLRERRPWQWACLKRRGS